MSAIAHRHTAFVSSAFARAPSDDARVRRQLACSAPTARVSRLSRGFSSRAPRARPATDTTASTSSARVIWFRIGDIRTHDHPALTAAASGSVHARPPRVRLRPRRGATHDSGRAPRPRTESVSDLRANLRAAGLDLIVRIGDPIAILPELAASVDAASIAVAEELEWCRAHAARAVDAGTLQSTSKSTGGRFDSANRRTRAKPPPPPPSKPRARRKARPWCPTRRTRRGWRRAGRRRAAPRRRRTPEDSRRARRRPRPSVDDVRAMAGLPDGEFDAAYDAAMEAAVAALNDPEFTRRRKRVSATDTAFVMLRRCWRSRRRGDDSGRAVSSSGR